MKRGFVWLMLLWMSCCIGELLAQRDKYKVRQGNKAFVRNDLKKAEADYRKALQINEGRTEARYGLARALQSQDKMEEAAALYQGVLDSLSQTLEGNKGEQTMRQMADVWHNLGNIAMKAKEYEKAIKAYQQSMILAPNDDETRYNLVLAQKLLQKDDKKEDNKQDQQQNQNQQKQQEEQKQRKQQPPSSPKQQQAGGDKDQNQEAGAQSRTQAEKILDAYRQEDERTRQKAEMALRNAKNKDKNRSDRKRW